MGSAVAACRRQDLCNVHAPPGRWLPSRTLGVLSSHQPCCWLQSLAGLGAGWVPGAGARWQLCQLAHQKRHHAFADASGSTAVPLQYLSGGARVGVRHGQTGTVGRQAPHLASK